VTIAIVIAIVIVALAIRAKLLWRSRRRPGPPRRSKRSYSDPG
jgi:FtsZ-interacting cell division protein ZipA